MGLFNFKNPFKPSITPQQGYADLDGTTKQLVDHQFEQANVPVGDIASSENARAANGTQSLVDPLAVQQKTQSLGGVPMDIADQALQRRSQKVYGEQLKKMNLAAQVGAYGKSSERQAGAFDKAARADEVKMGMYARQAEYDQNRKAVRQQIVSSLVNQGMSIAGTIVGGAMKTGKTPTGSSAVDPMDNTVSAANPMGGGGYGGA